MQKTRRTAIAVVVVVSSLTQGMRTAHAAGIALDVQSARATGMAAAVTAMVDDSSAIFFNAAGIAQGKKLDVQIGDTLIMPSFQYTSPGGVSTGNAFQVVPPFQAYETLGITDNLSVGVGVFTPFGLTLEWPPEWVGKSIITASSFITYDINPTVAYRFGPVRVGAGLQIVRGTVDLKRKIRTGADEAAVELGAGAWGPGANVGAQVDAIPKYLSLGVQYRSAVTFNFDGKAHFDSVPAEFGNTLVDQRVTTSLTTPDILQMGAASHPIKDLVIDVDVVWYGWSKFRSIDTTFPNDATGTLSSSEAKNWKNTVNVHAGAEGVISESWRVRGGVLFDPTPSPSSTLAPDVPDADRLSLAVGGGYVHPSGLRVDLAYQFLLAFKKTSTLPQFPGDYSGIVNIVGLSLGYQTGL
jgi:long-chain fatty acid transport protein